jgi:uncharacterized repeat protein (TIGR04076 family)
MEYDVEDADIKAFTEKVLKAENRYYQEVTVTKVDGACPYGHKVGDQFKVTAMNPGGLCGSLLKSIMDSVVTLHYGGQVAWGDDPDKVGPRVCPENGKVEVELKRVERTDEGLLKTPAPFIDMTGKGYPNLDRHRIFVNVVDIANDCYWGHKEGDRFEVDPFNVGGACSLLYQQMYPYIHVLLSGTTPPWTFEENTIGGECPDVYDRLCFRLSLEKR